jgi:site-specific DNA-cytosine methylase
MNLLELFAGSRSIGNAAEELNINVFSSDINNFDKINYVVDILDFDVNEVPFIPNIIWASPPCTSYSIAAISHHRPTGGELSEFAKKSDKMVLKIFEIIKHFKALNPNLIWYVENPRGMLRKQPFMLNVPKTTIWYCKYGDKRAKPTDIWSNNIYGENNRNGWIPREQCFNGNENCHHERAPRGSRTGTQGLKGNYERSKIPHYLCLEILKSSF